MVWSDSECPSCGATVAVSIMSLSATCACGMYYVDVIGERGWYFSPEHYMRCDGPVPEGGGRP